MLSELIEEKRGQLFERQASDYAEWYIVFFFPFSLSSLTHLSLSLSRYLSYWIKPRTPATSITFGHDAAVILP